LRELWINYELFDLYPGEPIAITKQVNNISELKDRQADYSNRFKAPATGNNLRICGFVNRTSSHSINPYTKLHCRYTENGSELISDGIAIIEAYAGGDIEITCYSGIFDFFDRLGEKSIRELDLSDADHTYDLDGVEEGFSSEYYCYPLIQWGATDREDNIVDIRYQMPAIKLSYVVDKIFEVAGYNKGGNVFNLDSYNSLWIPVVEDSLIDEPEVLESYSMRAHIGAVITPIVGNFERKIPFGVFNTGNAFDSSAGWYDVTTSNNYRWIARQKVTVNVRVIVYMNTPYSVHPSGSPTEVAHVFVRLNGGLNPVGEYRRFESLGGNPYDPSTVADIEINNLTLNPGDYLQVYWRDSSFNQIIYPYDTSSPPNYTKFEVEAINTIELNQPLYMSNLVPDITQKDLIKFIQNKYALIPQVDYITRTVNFVQFKEIAQKAKDDLASKIGTFGPSGYIAPVFSAYDWSDKLYISSNPKDPLNPKIRFRFDTYGQSNHLKWVQDDDRAEVGNGIIYVDDQTLPESKDLFEMPFAASIQETGFKGNLGVDIKRWTLNEDLEYEKTETVQPRILLLRDFVSTLSPPGPLDYTDGTSTIEIDNAKIAYFIDPIQPYDLSFQFIITEHYSDLVRVLNKTKIPTCFFRLSENEFKNLDFFKPVYVNYFGDYFYINIVPNFVNGRLASVELVRL
jgi:hypothetical protein